MTNEQVDGEGAVSRRNPIYWRLKRNLSFMVDDDMDEDDASDVELTSA